MPAWSRAPLTVALLALLLTVGPAIAATAVAVPATAPERGMSDTFESTASFEANTTYRIDMREDGDARWRLTVSFPLTNESQRDGFDVVADRFEEGEFLTVTPFEESSSQISDVTGRTMRITDVTRRVNTTDNRGELDLSFTWTNFGYRQGEQLYVDDVFQTENKLIPGLAEQETLIITRPNGYQFNSASTNIQDGTLRWDGPYTFGINEPYVSFDPIQAATTPNENEGDGATGTLLYALVGLVLLGSVATIAYAARRKEGPLFPFVEDDDTDTGAAAESEPDERPTGTEDEGTADAKPDSEDPDEAAGNEPASDEADVDDEQPAATDEEPVPTELLSDEERVERLLKANGGRMKQANIVEETGWSNAKVSQLLSAMDEADRIEKLRIGRENLISFPEDDPSDSES
jgi:hypothetical protein